MPASRFCPSWYPQPHPNPPCLKMLSVTQSVSFSFCHRGFVQIHFALEHVGGDFCSGNVTESHTYHGPVHIYDKAPGECNRFRLASNFVTDTIYHRAKTGRATWTGSRSCSLRCRCYLSSWYQAVAASRYQPMGCKCRQSACFVASRWSRYGEINGRQHDSIAIS